MLILNIDIVFHLTKYFWIKGSSKWILQRVGRYIEHVSNSLLLTATLIEHVRYYLS